MSDAAPQDGLAAVVDLGTNTFHLLVGRVTPEGRVVEVARDRHFVRVAADGIEKIGEAPYARAIAAGEAMGAVLARYPGIPTAGFATAALRTASNGPELRAALSEAIGIDIEVIDGDREAGLIAKAVLSAELPPAPRYLIMDIGGGSVEFILTEGGQTKYRESFPVGAQVLRRRFHKFEPFGKTPDAPQRATLTTYLDGVLAPLLAHCGFGGVQLVGSSGTFDVLADLFGVGYAPGVHTLTPQLVRDLYEEACAMTEAERFADTRIPDDRADMIVVALALVDWVMARLPQQQVVTCGYALKEGALLELGGRI